MGCEEQTYAIVTRSFLHDLAVEVIDELAAVGSHDLVGLLETLVCGFVRHFGRGWSRMMVDRGRGAARQRLYRDGTSRSRPAQGSHSTLSFPNSGHYMHESEFRLRGLSRQSASDEEPKGRSEKLSRQSAPVTVDVVIQLRHLA